MTLYRYGGIAWLWRAFIACGLLVGATLLVSVGRSAPIVAAALALPLVAPAVFFGLTVAVRIDADDSSLRVATLLGWRRHIARSRVSRARVYDTAEGYAGSFHAPRAWVSIRGALPVYVDLLGDTPHRSALDAALRLPRR